MASFWILTIGQPMRLNIMNKLILVRGLPGSGKSTLAREMIASGAADAHFEADMWLCRCSAYDEKGFFKGFTTVARDYYWSPDRIKAAHAACIEAATLALWSGKTVVISNTFTKEAVKPLPLGRGCRAVLLLDVLFQDAEWCTSHTSSKVGRRPQRT